MYKNLVQIGVKSDAISSDQIEKSQITRSWHLGHSQFIHYNVTKFVQIVIIFFG